MLSKDDEWMADAYRRASIVDEFERRVCEERKAKKCTRAAAVNTIMDLVAKAVAKDEKKRAMKEIIEIWLKSSRSLSQS